MCEDPGAGCKLNTRSDEDGIGSGFQLASTMTKVPAKKASDRIGLPGDGINVSIEVKMSIKMNPRYP